MQLVKFFTNQKGITDFETQKMKDKIRELDGKLKSYEMDEIE